MTYSMWTFLWTGNSATFKQSNTQALKSNEIKVDYLQPWLSTQQRTVTFTVNEWRTE